MFTILVLFATVDRLEGPMVVVEHGGRILDIPASCFSTLPKEGQRVILPKDCAYQARSIRRIDEDCSTY